VRVTSCLLLCAVLSGMLLSIGCCCFGGLDDDEFVDVQYFGHNEGSGGDA
jgi:hypothetical protein